MQIDFTSQITIIDPATILDGLFLTLPSILYKQGGEFKNFVNFFFITPSKNIKYSTIQNPNIDGIFILMKLKCLEDRISIFLFYIEQLYPIKFIMENLTIKLFPNLLIIHCGILIYIYYTIYFTFYYKSILSYT
jgi:hypothetical protein